MDDAIFCGVLDFWLSKRWNFRLVSSVFRWCSWWSYAQVHGTYQHKTLYTGTLLGATGRLILDILNDPPLVLIVSFIVREPSHAPY